MITEQISIRSVQHYMYCPHRWGLLEIDRAWAENMFVTKANLMHERVHDPDKNYFSRGKEVYTSVPVYNDRNEYNLYGVTDCLELAKDEKGTFIRELEGAYKICIVEYKPTKPRDREYREEDLMQVFAQKICVDYIWNSDCGAAIYYADVRRRVMLPVKEKFEELDRRLKEILRNMRQYLEEGKIPAVRKGQICSGCSMKDLCMPALKHTGDIQTDIRRILESQI